jgi:hypothetical protein
VGSLLETWSSNLSPVGEEIGEKKVKRLDQRPTPTTQGRKRKEWSPPSRESWSCRARRGCVWVADKEDSASEASCQISKWSPMTERRVDGERVARASNGRKGGRRGFIGVSKGPGGLRARPVV